MARKLAAEGRSFRQLLTQVRMSHALTLLQQGLAPLETALACGYDSPQPLCRPLQAGVRPDPYQYLRTCPSSSR